jgi:hypothetical protein
MFVGQPSGPVTDRVTLLASPPHDVIHPPVGALLGVQSKNGETSSA